MISEHKYDMVKQTLSLFALYSLVSVAFADTPTIDLPKSSSLSLLERDANPESSLLERETGVKQYRPRINLNINENHKFNIRANPQQQEYEIRYTWKF